MEELIGILLKHLLDDDIRDGKTDYIKEGREKAEVLEYHFENEYPEKLLRVQHPSEEFWMREYRKRRWQAPTKVATGRVFTFLQKIQQADDFKIRFESDYTKTGIAEQVEGNSNTLQDYVDGGMPLIKSLETWLFNVFLKTYLQDANAIVVVMPDIRDFIKDPNEPFEADWSKPYPHTIETEYLIYEDNEWVIYKTESWKDENRKEWCQYIAVTLSGIFLFRQIGPFHEANPFKVYLIPYEFKTLPVVKVGNVVCEEEDGHIVYDSVLEPCIPAWNEVLYRTDDLNILFAIHALPQKWALKLTPCKTCNGTGERVNNRNERIHCGECNGSGRAKATPFGIMEINMDKATAVNPNPVIPPIPPAGYIERPIDSVKLFQEDIAFKEFQGFKAIGLEILGQIPAGQSGIAKEYDRKELNTFCFSVCVHISEIYKLVCYHILYQRYNSLFSSNLISDEKVKAALPKITIPTDFDVLTASMVGLMLSQARRDHYSPIIIHGIEVDYVEKLYGENSPQKTYLKIVNALDPLPFKTTEEKILIKDSQGCTPLDFVISSNISSIVMELMENDRDWYMKSIQDQRKDVYRLGEQKLASVNASIVPIIA